MPPKITAFDRALTDFRRLTGFRRMWLDPLLPTPRTLSKAMDAAWEGAGGRGRGDREEPGARRLLGAGVLMVTAALTLFPASSVLSQRQDSSDGDDHEKRQATETVRCQLPSQIRTSGSGRNRLIPGAVIRTSMLHCAQRGGQVMAEQDEGTDKGRDG